MLRLLPSSMRKRASWTVTCLMFFFNGVASKYATCKTGYRSQGLAVAATYLIA